MGGRTSTEYGEGDKLEEYVNFALGVLATQKKSVGKHRLIKLTRIAYETKNGKNLSRLGVATNAVEALKQRGLVKTAKNGLVYTLLSKE